MLVALDSKIRGFSGCATESRAANPQKSEAWRAFLPHFDGDEAAARQFAEDCARGG